MRIVRNNEPDPVYSADERHERTVREVREKLGKSDASLRLAEIFKLYADGSRVEILRALEVQEMCVCELAALLCVTKSAISHQLKALRLANLVRYRRDGQIVYYSLADEHVRCILDAGLTHLNER